MHYIKSLSWEEVFDIWRKNEEHNTAWIEHSKSMGFESWDEWRMQYAKALKCSERAWRLYEVFEPLKSIPHFRGGPFKSWIEKYYEARKNPTFAELAQHTDWQNHASIQELITDFPKETTLIGLIQDGQIIILDGMHRCMAIALAAQKKVSLHTNIYIALADASGEELPEVGQFKK